MTTVGSHTQNASLSAAVSIAVPDAASHLVIGTTTQNVRLTFDGTVPTATKGFLVVAGQEPAVFPVNAADTIKVIEVTASATIDYQFVRGWNR